MHTLVSYLSMIISGVILILLQMVVLKFEFLLFIANT